ncbi:MAG: outer membrane beta-barrel protein [Azoarcus sp.]|jgi:outer membrane protein|nr:outer membrane beta-barrel protein [Azoarcus sp.]
MKKQLLAAAIAAFTVSGVAVAHEAGDVILRLGVAHVSPEVNSGRIKTAATGKLGDSKVSDVESNTQLGLTATWIVAPHLGVEILAATPFTHDIKVKGVDSALNDLGLTGTTIDGKFGKAKHLPPTVSAQYFFLDPKSKFQPYVGLGLNYTIFLDASLSRKAKDNGFDGLDLENSWGWAAQLGADVAITDKLFLNAAVWKIDINTTATSHNAIAGKTKVNVEIDPWVVFLGLGWKF